MFHQGLANIFVGFKPNIYQDNYTGETILYGRERQQNMDGKYMFKTKIMKI